MLSNRSQMCRHISTVISRTAQTCLRGHGHPVAHPAFQAANGLCHLLMLQEDRADPAFLQLIWASSQRKLMDVGKWKPLAVSLGPLAGMTGRPALMRVQQRTPAPCRLNHWQYGTRRQNFRSLPVRALEISTCSFSFTWKSTVGQGTGCGLHYMYP